MKAKDLIKILGQDPIFRYFSTEQTAKEYILKNKPVLSYNNVWNSTTNKSSDNNYVVIEKKKLLELVKSKI